MPSRNRLLLLSLVLLILSPFLMADMGPKPGMDFELFYDISPVPTITEVILMECSQPDCAGAVPLEELGPQGIRCPTNTTCDSMAYGYSGDHFQLLLSFDDGSTRTSNTFEKKHFNSEYEVRILDDLLVVEEVGGSGNPANMVFYGILGVAFCSMLVLIAAAVLIVRYVFRRQAEKKAAQVEL
ncbi:MAG TPA: hypothetical protein VJ965_03415 [Anaerolineales bacterium]|nr:hypothetical protein [Anaerolineales bacterium]